MINKIYASFKDYIKENWPYLLTILIVGLLMNYPLPYYIMTSGGTIDVEDRVFIEGEKDKKGSFNLAYVNELKGNVLTYSLSKVIPSWDAIDASNFKIDDEETARDITNRSNLDLLDSLQSSVSVAYKTAKKEFKVKGEKYYIYYVFEEAEGDIRVGDELIGAEDKIFKNIDEFREIINKHKEGDQVKVKIKRNGKEKDVSLKLFKKEEELYTGVLVKTILEYDTDPKIKFNFRANESGSSGGFTMALSIYNKLVKEDITKGKKIVGTGTIDMLGNIGEIGGVKYKLSGAVKGEADIFIVPNGDNYEEAIKEKKKNNYNIEIIGVSTFEEAIKKLEELK